MESYQKKDVNNLNIEYPFVKEIIEICSECEKSRIFLEWPLQMATEVLHAFKK